MRRLSLAKLEEWKKKPRRKPLLLRGARQVGKTWLVRELGKSYSQFVEVNLEERQHLLNTIKTSYGDPMGVVRVLETEFNMKINLETVLLFFDEIQICKEALLMLRYFKEKAPHVHVIAAGSLLEFAISEISFPVGRVEFMYLFPMNFEEFLMALNRDDLVERLSSIEIFKKIDSHTHEKLNTYLNEYFFVGGMPEVVFEYFATEGSRVATDVVKQNLLSNIREDFYKYSSRSRIDYVRKVFDSIPLNLAKKLKYSNIDREAKSRDLLAAMTLLRDAGIIYQVHHTSANGLPLSAEKDPQKFKAFLHDVGLCVKLMNVSKENWQTLINKGELAEQFVAQEILSYTHESSTPELFYWHREAKSASSEVDLVTSAHGKTIPIEVKSGSNLTSKSLGIFLNEKKSVSSAFKLSPQPFRQFGKVSMVPLYGVKAILAEEL
ncbi:MAG: ATP-binding protein [Pseudomonadota bacterium]